MKILFHCYGKLSEEKTSRKLANCSCYISERVHVIYGVIFFKQ